MEEAVPHLKSSQVMVKGKVEPATLVGFIHKCTGRRAAIIRAEPLDDLLPQSANSPAAPAVVVAPPVEAESKKDEPSENSPEEKKNGQQNGKKEEINEENKAGGGEEEEDHVDESPETAKPGDAAGEGHGAHAGEAPNHNNGGDGLVVENHTKDGRLFTVPMPAGVVTVAPEMALSNRSYYYPPPAYPYAQYYYPYNQYYQYPQPYPAYAACSPAAMYGHGYPPEAFCEENPNACTIV